MVLAQESPRRFFTIGTVARMPGVDCSPTMLRKLEARGLIPPPVRVEGTDLRLYSPEDVEAIRRARAGRVSGTAERAAV